MLRIQPKQEVTMGPSIQVALPKDDHDTLTLLAEFSGQSRGKIIADSMSLILEHQRKKNPEFARYLKGKANGASAK